MPSPESTPVHPDLRFYRLCQALVVVLCVAAFFQIHTYAVVSDPAFYLEMGKRTAEQISAGQVPHLFIAPVHPLFLAVIRLAGGPYPPYWTNLLIWPLAVLVMMRALRRLPGSPETAGLAGVGLIAFLWLRRTDFPNFLLYPYREPLALLFSFAAFGLLMERSAEANQRKKSPLGPLMAGLLLTLAGATREPFFILLIPAAWQAWHEGKESLGQKFLHGGAVFLPLLIGVLLALIIPQTRSFITGGQALMYIGRMRDGGLGAGAFALAGWRLLLVTLAILPLLSLVGIRVLRHWPSTFRLWSLGAFLLFMVHAPIRDHDRYALVTALFLWPPAVLTLRHLWARYQLPSGRAIRRIALSAATMSALLATPRMHGWGLPADTGDIRRLRQLLLSLGQDASILVDNRCRALSTLLYQFTPARLLRQPPRRQAALTKLIYVRPLNDYATAGKGPDFPGADLEAEVTATRDLVFPASEYSLDLAQFAFFKTTPFRAHTAEIPMPDAFGQALLWLDFRSCEIPLTASLGLPNTDLQLTLSPPLGPGWHGIPLEVPFTGATAYSFASSAPFPADLRPQWSRPGRPAIFPLDERRTPSELLLIDNPERIARLEKYAAVLTHEIALRLPPAASDSPFDLKVSLVISPRRRPAFAPRHWIVAEGQSIDLQDGGRPAHIKQSYARTLQGILPAGSRKFRLLAEPAYPDDAPLRIHEIQLEPVSASPR